MLIISEETDLDWSDDECIDDKCISGQCKAIRERLHYQRMRNQHVRELNKDHNMLFKRDMRQDEIKRVVDFFRMGWLNRPHK
jgi:TATA-binding protein-associated factor Taf7